MSAIFRESMKEHNMDVVLTSPLATTLTPEHEPDAAGWVELTGAACGAGAVTRVKRLFESSRKAYLDLACSRITFVAGATVSAALANPGSKLAEQDGADVWAAVFAPEFLGFGAEGAGWALGAFFQCKPNPLVFFFFFESICIPGLQARGPDRSD